MKLGLKLSNFKTDLKVTVIQKCGTGIKTDIYTNGIG